MIYEIKKRRYLENTPKCYEHLFGFEGQKKENAFVGNVESRGF